MKNPLFDPNVADPAKTPDPFSANPLKDKELEQTEDSANQNDEDPQTFVQYY